MKMGYLITNALIVSDGRRFNGSVLISDGMIVEIFPGRIPLDFPIPEQTRIVDAGGRYLLPGVIDDQVHFRDPGLTEKGDLYTESRAAVAGGVTSFMDMPNTIPNATTIELLEQKFDLASEKSLANYSFFLGATNDNLKEIKKAEPLKICGIKVFMGASTGNMLVDDPYALEQIFKNAPLLVAVHSEDETIIRANLESYRARYGDNIPVEAHPLIRSEEACFASSERASRLARKHGTRLHLLHLSTAKETELLSNDRPMSEKRITGEVCVHHLWFDDRDYPGLGARIKWNPAIKSERNRKGLFEALLDDRIDIIATDHAPHLLKEKDKPYLTCPSGAPFVQHSLVAMMAFHHLGNITVEKIVSKMCHNPAILYGIDRRGFIRKGYYADLVLLDPDAPWVVGKENILYKCGWSPLEGVTFRSRVTHTWVNGNLVFENGIINDVAKGERLSFYSNL